MQERDPADLDGIYDPATLARLDRPVRTRSESPDGGRPTTTGRWRRGTATGVLITGLGLGLREVLAPAPNEPVIEEIDPNGLLDREQPVRFVLVEGAPRASRIVLRPWLLYTT